MTRKWLPLVLVLMLVSTVVLWAQAANIGTGQNTKQTQGADASILTRIRQDHQTVKTLLRKMLQTTPQDAQTRQELTQRLFVAMNTHANSEEKVLYAGLLEAKPGNAAVLKAREEHHTAEMVLNEIRNTPVQDERWKARVAVFNDLVNRHIAQEENQIFRLSQRTFSRQQLANMGSTFAREKQAEQARQTNQMRGAATPERAG